MSGSRAIANPFHGTIRVSVGSDDEGTDLPIEHDLAPWPADEHAVSIATQALSGMGWTVTHADPIPPDPDAQFTLDVIPSPADT